VTAPQPDDRSTDRRSGVQRFTPADLEQQAERQRCLAERRTRDSKRKAAWLAEKTRRAKRARLAAEAAAPEEAAG
jgi:hypothetical protein